MTQASPEVVEDAKRVDQESPVNEDANDADSGRTSASDQLNRANKRPDTAGFLPRVRKMSRRIAGRLQRFLGSSGHSSTGDLLPYKRLAQRLTINSEITSSALVLTPGNSTRAAESCVVLSKCISDCLNAPVLLVDVTDGSNRLGEIVGVRGRRGDQHASDFTSRSERIYEEGEQFFFMTREGVAMGPYDDYKAARLGLQEFLQEAINQEYRNNASSSEPRHLQTRHELVSFLPHMNAATVVDLSVSKGTELSERPTSIVEDLRGDHKFVVFFAGSLDDSPLALRLAAHVDSVLIEAVENETLTSQFKAAVDTLRSCGARNLSSVMIKGNDDHLLLRMIRKLLPV